MRKIEALMLNAVRQRKDWRSGNTSVEVSEHGPVRVRLHGNLIGVVSLSAGELQVNACGWLTATTKSRLNALLSLAEGQPGLFQRDGRWFLAGQEWDGCHTTVPMDA